jgi:hypothetical protein
LIEAVVMSVQANSGHGTHPEMEATVAEGSAVPMFA